jgi:hypothetical protein
MDVLAYSAFNQQLALNQQIVEKTGCLSTKCSQTAAKQALAAVASIDVCWVKCIEPCLLRQPERTSFWSCIKTLPATGCPWIDGFKVCNTATQFNCGQCCNWVVPEGVTCARFQIWGAGGGSTISRCCGGSPFGSTGAYASVIIPVTAGNSYTLCSGCALCCRGCNNNYNGGDGRYAGCQSYVTGTGLCNFCANGGQGRLGTWMAAYGKAGGSQRLSTIAFENAGSCLCQCGTYYCFINSCATCGEIPHVAGAGYFGTTTSASSPTIVYGIRGMWPTICYDTNHAGYQCHPPIYGFPNTSRCIFTWNSSCCGGGFRAENGFLQIPGAGGYPNISFAGCVCGQCGDIGRMGMVCVSFR